MQDEELDKLITEAANQHHPPYNDKDWEKMQLLLNKHLPQEKDRRKPLFFLLFLLFISVGIITTAIIQPWKKAASSTNIEPAVSSAYASKAENKAVDNTAESTISTQPQQKNKISSNTTTISNTAVSEINNISTSSAVATVKKIKYKKRSKTKMKVKAAGIAEDNNEDAAISSVTKEVEKIDDIKTTSSKTGIENEEEKNDAVVINKSDANTLANVTDSTYRNKLKDSATTIEVSKKKNEKKEKTGFAKNFALVAAAGGDVSYVSLNNMGKLKTFYGAGLSYVINKRFRISSGIMVSNKIYTAKPTQYKLPYGTTYPNLQKIDAECKIYEILLMVYYNFAQKNRHNWFAATGFSSLIMKKEVYNYINKYPSSGQIYVWTKSVANKNSHFLSVVTVSGGYQYNATKRFSFMAEPYIKLPLNGVGEGKVKLNSTGVLFSVAFKPFIK